MWTFITFVLLVSLVGTLGAPAILESRSITPLSIDQLSAFSPYTQFARAAYCSTASLKTWSCGGKSNLR